MMKRKHADDRTTHDVFDALCIRSRGEIVSPAPPDAIASAVTKAAVDKETVRSFDSAVVWAVERWHAEVANRPLVNIHRRTLDDTWRQVIRHFGGDVEMLLPLPDHDTMLANAKPKNVEEAIASIRKAQPMGELILDGGEKLDGSSRLLKLNDTPDGTCVTISAPRIGIVAVLDRQQQRELVAYLAKRLWPLTRKGPAND